IAEIDTNRWRTGELESHCPRGGIAVPHTRFSLCQCLRYPAGHILAIAIVRIPKGDRGWIAFLIDGRIIDRRSDDSAVWSKIQGFDLIDGPVIRDACRACVLDKRVQRISRLAEEVDMIEHGIAIAHERVRAIKRVRARWPIVNRARCHALRCEHAVQNVPYDKAWRLGIVAGLHHASSRDSPAPSRS